MSLSDKIINGIMGTNIRTIKVSVEQLAQIVNETIIAATTNEEELRAIEKAIKGSHFFISGDWESSDGKFLFHISLYQRSLKHRTVWVKNLQTEEIFEWNGFSLGPFKRAMQPYLVNARMHPPISWYRDQIIQDAVNAMDGDPAEAQDPAEAYDSEEMSESIPNETAFYEPFNKPMPRRQNPAVIGVITVVVLIVIGVAVSMYEENMKEKQAARQKELEQEYQQALQQVYQQQDSSQNSQQQAGSANLQGSGSSANSASSGYGSTYDYNSTTNDYDTSGYDTSGYDTSGYDTSDYDDEESGDEDEYIFPDSDTTYLTKSDLKGMSADELNYAKNELYARHGRIFNREDLQEYFEDCSWYEGVYTADEWDSYGDSYFFNDVEMANRNLLVKTEKKRR